MYFIHFVTQLKQAWSYARTTHGIALLEIAIALIILGIISGTSLSLLHTQRTLVQDQNTQNHQERVLQAIASYAIRHGMLPCPADDSVAKSSELSGISRPHCTQGTLWMGHVPFRTLGLSQKFAHDGKGQMMTYAVYPRMTWPPGDLSLSTRMNTLCSNPKTHHFTVRDGLVPVLSKTHQDVIAVILISHGSRTSFSSLTPHLSCAEENRAPSAAFCQMPSASEKGKFSDVVRWETWRNLIRFYGGLTCSPR